MPRRKNWFEANRAVFAEGNYLRLVHDKSVAPKARLYADGGMVMKVILSQDVAKLGNKGDVIDVAEGYGRNFLLPRRLAVPATKANLNAADEAAKNKAYKAAQNADEAKLLAHELTKVELNIPVRIGAGGKLYGKVTGQTVADALKKMNIDIDRKKITVPDVTGVGEYVANAKIHEGITAAIKFNVVQEK